MITVQLNSKLGPREGTIPAALFTEQNEISLYGEVTSQSALDAALQLRYLVLHNAREVTLSIHSPGGSVRSSAPRRRAWWSPPAVSGWPPAWPP